MKTETQIDLASLNEIDLEARLKGIFRDNSAEEARNIIGRIIPALNPDVSKRVNSICSRIYEDMGRNSSGSRSNRYFVFSLLCAHQAENLSRVYALLDDEKVNNVARAYANAGIAPPEKQHPMDVLLDLITSRDPSHKLIDQILVDYFKVRGKNLENYRRKYICGDRDSLDDGTCFDFKENPQ